VTVVTLMKTVIWHDQGSETVRQRLRDVDEAHGMIQEVGSRGKGAEYRKGRLVIFKEKDVGSLYSNDKRSHNTADKAIGLHEISFITDTQQ